MSRREFIKRGFLGTIGLVTASKIQEIWKKESEKKTSGREIPILGSTETINADNLRVLVTSMQNVPGAPWYIRRLLVGETAWVSTSNNAFTNLQINDPDGNLLQGLPAPNLVGLLSEFEFALLKEDIPYLYPAKSYPNYGLLTSGAVLMTWEIWTTA